MDTKRERERSVNRKRNVSLLRNNPQLDRKSFPDCFESLVIEAMYQITSQVSRSITRSPLCRKIILPVNGEVFLRLISTSNSDGPKCGGGDHERHIPPSDPREMGRPDVVIGPGIGKAPPGPKTVEEFKDVASQKNWISYGYDYVDKRTDRWWNSYSLLTMISIFMCTFGFIAMYYPDYRLETWATREAYLEMARRKQLGMKPYISKDYANPDNIVLPTEEELEGFQIIL